jgi:hypothetical protein
VARGVLGPFSGAISVVNLASTVGVARPVSVRQLITRIDNLRPASTPPSKPSISVEFSGTITDAHFAVTGSGFLQNLPGTRTSSVAIRVVDANVAIETRREFARTNGNGKIIDHVIRGNLSGLAINALGIATIAFSATDGRPGSGEDFLWSNTVRINFRADGTWWVS